MTKGDNPRLCGDTFFVLVLQALKQRIKARQHYKGERDGLSDPEALVGLIKVINPDYQEPKEGALKGKTNDFKSCKASTGQYLPFGDTPEVEAFDERIWNEYEDALGAMTEFVALFLETGTKVKKDERLVKALIDLIEQDDSIKPDDKFYIEEDGGKIKKTALGGLDGVLEWGGTTLKTSQYDKKALEIVLPDVIISEDALKVLNDFQTSMAKDGIEVWYRIAK